MGSIGDLAVGGVVLVGLGVALVKILYRWLKGGALIGVAFAIGALFASCGAAMSMGLIPEQVAQWLEVAVIGLAGGAAVVGGLDAVDTVRTLIRRR